MRIVKSSPVAAMATVAPMMAQPVGAAPVAGAAAPHAAAPAAAPVETGHTVKSPMVGTFYRSSSPGAKPFVELGS
ncbi:hypothetical protein ABTC87_18760, partial [Acinetobacter baumannii]